MSPEIPDLHMKFASLQNALEEYYGEDSEICSPEDESDAWKSIVGDYRHGSYPDLLRDLDALLKCSDAEIMAFLRSCAPQWSDKTAADARYGLEVFSAYVSTYAE